MRFRFPQIALLLVTTVLSAGPALAQKEQIWTEVRSPHFVVVSSAGEKQARNVAEQFEAFRSAFAELFPRARVDLGKPLTILAVKNEKDLRALLPGFWEKKGQSHPAGIFVPGQEKLYVALRTDTQGEFPFQVIYHEYAHALMRMNFRDLPAWLSEGLAEIFGHSLISSREVTMGRPSSYHLMLLQESRLLPLDVLLTVDHTSPHYNEQDKSSVFYAQSWALTHYIYLSKPGRDGELFNKYVASLSQGASPVEAAKAFGDFKKFQRTIENYIRQGLYFAIKTKPSAEIDEKTFPARALPPAESAALRGDFQVHMNRPTEARALLEQALRLDSGNALAHESMGVLHLRQQDMAAAAQWFEKAAALDSRSFLAHYFTAMLAVQRGGISDDFEKVEASLLKAIELNKDFAPAYSTLSNLYLARDEKLDDALNMARRAAQIEPGVLFHHINVASVLLRMDKVHDAVRLARSVAAAAKDPKERAAADSFLQGAERYVEERKEYEAAKREAEERAARRTAEIEAWEKKSAAEEAERLIRAENVVDPSGQQAVARGTIAEVTCPGAQSMSLHLTLSASTLQLRTAKRTQVAYYTTRARATDKPAPFNPCKELRGQRVQVVYRPVKGAAYAGEILAVELLADAASARTAVASGSAPVAQPASTDPPASTGITPAKPRVAGTLAEGRAAAVACTPPSEMMLTIDFGGVTIRVHAEDRSRVQFTMRGGPVPVNFDPCTQLRGRKVAVLYKDQEGGGYAGSILAVDIQH